MKQDEKERRYSYIRTIFYSTGFIDLKDICIIIPEPILCSDMDISAAILTMGLGSPDTFQFCEIRKMAEIIGLEFKELAALVSAKISGTRENTRKIETRYEPIREQIQKRWVEKPGKTFYQLFQYITTEKLATGLNISKHDIFSLINDPLIISFAQLDRISVLTGIPLITLVELVVDQITSFDNSITIKK